jgi:ribonuclease J
MDGYRLETAVAARNELLFLPLGGSGEIGMNLNLYFHDGKWVMVDLGVSFGIDLPGIEVVMPDPSFIVERKDDLLGIVLTHGHEDHLGAVPHLWPRLRCPVYATPFTASLLRRKLQEFGLAREVKIIEIPLGGRFKLGPFDFELITMTHSIPEPNALAIRTPVGTILHTGDWKLDSNPLIGEVSDEKRLSEVGDEGVLALIGDSTNVFRQGEAGSEADVRDSLIDLVGQCAGRVAIACFASNVARLESAIEAARAHDRHVALVGRSLYRMEECARENGYIAKHPPFIDEEDIADIPPDKLLMICTGSQGEARAALARIAAHNHPNAFLDEGDTVIFSSRVIPGNEVDIGHLQDRLVKAGIHVITERDHFVHVSGHPARDELKRMYAHIRPQIAIPVHGELRHMAEHADLARDCGVKHTLVVANGDVVRLGPGDAAVIDRVHAGRLALDGNRLIADDAVPVRERLRMHGNGLAVATLVLGAKGKLVADPLVTMHGLVDEPELSELSAQLSGSVRGAVEALDQHELAEDETVAEAARLALRRVLKLQLGRKPVLDIHLVRV